MHAHDAALVAPRRHFGKHLAGGLRANSKCPRQLALQKNLLRPQVYLLRPVSIKPPKLVDSGPQILSECQQIILSYLAPICNSESILHKLTRSKI